MRYQEFKQSLFEKEISPGSGINDKLSYIQQQLDKGEITDPETIDFIYKILNKTHIKKAISANLNDIALNDEDVAKFEKLNQGIMASILRKLPIKKEQMDDFLTTWSKSLDSNKGGFVDTSKLKSGSSGNVSDLIPNPIAKTVFDTFEKVRTQYKMPKKGTAGYGEFGLSMLSGEIAMKAPGDIEVNGVPIECKGNDARLYADERTKAVQEGAASTVAKKGSQPGLISNVIVNLRLPIEGEENKENKAIVDEVTKEVINAFNARGYKNTQNLIKQLKELDDNTAFDLLKREWWRAGFESYQKAIGMPIMVLDQNKFYISANADDFINWGCLPKSASNYGYIYGRQAGQSRETYPKIFIPGRNK